MLNVEFGTLELIDQSNSDAVVVYSYGAKHLFNGMRIPANKGLNSHIRTTRKPLLVNNIADTPDILELKYYEECSGLAGAPMIAEEELLGFLWIGRKSTISEYELRLLAAMADIAASSIRRMKLHEITEKQLNKLTSLRNIDISINNSKDLHTTLGVLLDQTRNQLQADAADILLCNQATKSLECELGRGFNSELFTADALRRSDGPAGLAAKTKKLVHIKNLAQLGESHPLAIAAHEEGFTS
jgi:GAF domain-containing protein